MGFYEDIISGVVSGRIASSDQLQKEKQRLARRYKLERIPSNVDILMHADPDMKGKLGLLVKKPTRSLSGVSVIAVMTKPLPCPGRCIYCPRGDAAQSYTGQEPAALRAKQNAFDPYRQTLARLRQLDASGHPTDKIEVIIMGGTFTSAPLDYQVGFVKGVFDALNGEKANSLEEAHILNERAKHRCVGLTFEVRPDYCKRDDIKRMLLYGGTRVELGVQTVYDDIYKKIRRDHTVADVVRATHDLKDSAFKVCYHIMPGLPYSNRSMDIEAFKRIFTDERFMPDMLKIYPTLLAREKFYTDKTIWKLYRSGEWKPLDNSGAVDIIAEALRYIPKWVRIMRMQRDIPARLIAAGVTSGNLRELVYKKAEEKKIKIREIRYREVGIRIRDGYEIGEPKMVREEYKASGGIENYIAFEDDNETLFGFIRLRKPDDPFLEWLDKKTAFIRELHVYGPEAEIGKHDILKIQHKGLGEALISEAERIAREEWGFDRIVVISGIGVRLYYKKFGYKRVGPYMSKKLIGA